VVSACYSLPKLTKSVHAKVEAFLAGHSIEEIASPPLSGKKPMKVQTVQNALIDAVKAGVQLPNDRVLAGFSIGGGGTVISNCNDDENKSTSKVASLQLH
jgi:hypothetical protein